MVLAYSAKKSLPQIKKGKVCIKISKRSNTPAERHNVIFTAKNKYTSMRTERERERRER